MAAHGPGRGDPARLRKVVLPALPALRGALCGYGSGQQQPLEQLVGIRGELQQVRGNAALSVRWNLTVTCLLRSTLRPTAAWPARSGLPASTYRPWSPLRWPRPAGSGA